MTPDAATMAAWQPEPGMALDVGPSSPATLGAHDILVRNTVVAINPFDVLLHEQALLPWVRYPTILGTDVAGDVLAIGTAVTRFAVGDRVLGLAVGTSVNQPERAGFQQQTVLHDKVTCRIPDAMTFEDAAVLPLAISTAACGLYQREQLGLEFPSSTAAARGSAVLVWGASSAVGYNAVQLAVASGYDVVAVGSASGAALLHELGAVAVLDHRQADIVDCTSNILRDRTLVGTLHAAGDLAQTLAIVARSDGSPRIASTWFPPDDVPEGVEINLIHGQSLKDDGLGNTIFESFLPQALADGRYRALPPPRVVGEGLGALQGALAEKQRGTSGVKLVVRLR